MQLQKKLWLNFRMGNKLQKFNFSTNLSPNQSYFNLTIIPGLAEFSITITTAALINIFYFCDITVGHLLHTHWAKCQMRLHNLEMAYSMYSWA